MKINSLFVCLLFIVSIESLPQRGWNRGRPYERHDRFWRWEGGRGGERSHLYDQDEPGGRRELAYFSDPIADDPVADVADDLVKPEPSVRARAHKSSSDSDKLIPGKPRGEPSEPIGQPSPVSRSLNGQREDSIADSSAGGEAHSGIGAEANVNGGFIARTIAELRARRQERFRRLREAYRSVDLDLQLGLRLRLKGNSGDTPSNDKGIKSFSSLESDDDDNDEGDNYELKHVTNFSQDIYDSD